MEKSTDKKSHNGMEDSEIKLAAPIWELAFFNGNNIVTQPFHDACAGSGYPVLVPSNDDMRLGDVINLYAYSSIDTNRTVKAPLSSYTLIQGDIGNNLVLDFPVEAPPMETNGDYNLAYQYLRDGVSLGDSEPTLITIDLFNTNPYGFISPNLAPPIVSPLIYNLDDYNKNLPIEFSAIFKDASTIRQGDTIQPSFHVIGYTMGNYNVVSDRKATPYTITKADIRAGTTVFKFPDPTSTPPRQTWTQSDLAGIDGSRGGMFVTYKGAGNAVSESSPTSTWTVDVVAPYSQPPHLRVEEALAEIKRVREAELAKRHAGKTTPDA